MEHFNTLQDRVFERLGESTFNKRLPLLHTAETLIETPDSRYLSTLCRRVFRAGLKHALVDSKWPAFEKAFFGFDPEKLCLLSDEQLEQHMHNTELIRHWGKIKSIRANAIMVSRLSRQHQGFGRIIADWPATEIIELWALLKKEGSQLGGQSGPAFLRMVGKDSFRLTNDVVVALKAQGVVSKAPTAKRDLRAVQDAFNEWQQQSNGKPMAYLSLLLAHSIGDG